MNHGEATRYAHRWIADAIDTCVNMGRANVFAGPDEKAIRTAIDRWRELHARHGPMASDRPPRKPEYKGEPLPLEAPHEVATVDHAITEGVSRDAPRSDAGHSQNDEAGVSVDARSPEPAPVSHAAQPAPEAAVHDARIAVVVEREDPDAPGSSRRRGSAGNFEEMNAEIAGTPSDDALRLTLGEDVEANDIAIAFKPIATCSHRSLKRDGFWRCVAEPDHSGPHQLEKEQRASS